MSPRFSSGPLTLHTPTCFPIKRAGKLYRLRPADRLRRPAVRPRIGLPQTGAFPIANARLPKPWMRATMSCLRPGIFARLEIAGRSWIFGNPGRLRPNGRAKRLLASAGHRSNLSVATEISLPRPGRTPWTSSSNVSPLFRAAANIESANVVYESDEDDDSGENMLERTVRHILKAQVIAAQEAYQRHLVSVAKGGKSWDLR